MSLNINLSISDDPTINITTVKGAQTQLILYRILIPAIGTLIIVLNLAVVLSSGLILKRGTQPRTTYLFLGNVAMSDLITGVAVLFGELYPKDKRDQATCVIQLGMIVSSTLTSIWSVGLIAVDRYLYILKGLKYQQLLYPRRARVLILFTWVIGLIIGFLPAMGWSGYTDGGKVCWFILLAPPGLILLTTVVGFIPVLLVCVLYGIILHRAIRKVIQLRRADKAAKGDINYGETGPQNMRISRGKKRGENDGKTKISSPTKWKAVKVVLFTTGSFVSTWVPYFIACSIFVLCGDEKSTKCKTIRVAIGGPLAILGFVNSLLNPIIYAWWHNGFRSSMKKLLSNKCWRKKTGSNNVPGIGRQGTQFSEGSSTKTTGISSASTKSSTSNKSTAVVEFNPHIETCRL